MPTYEVYKEEISKFTLKQLQEELIAQEKSLAGFKPGHYIRPNIEMQINQLKEKISSGVYASEAIILSSTIQKIINDWHDHNLILPSWFANNNVNWVISGHITEAEFFMGFNDLLNQNLAYYITEPTPPVVTPPVVTPPVVTPPVVTPPVVTPPIVTPPVVTPPIEPDPTITDNMVTQQMINFNIVNGRAVGSIRFVATNNFNPFYYGKNIVNLITFKDPNNANILTFVKENRLNFTATERDEVISYDEDMQGNTRATVESFVWSSATTPTPFSKMYSIEISEAEPPKPLTSGFMSAGAAGAIAGLVLLGFIIDHKVSKR